MTCLGYILDNDCYILDNDCLGMEMMEFRSYECSILQDKTFFFP